MNEFEATRRLTICEQENEELHLKLSAALKAKEEAERNEARYLWLRDKSSGQYEHPLVVAQHRYLSLKLPLQNEQSIQYIGPVVGKQLDDNIDAAIDAQRGK